MSARALDAAGITDPQLRAAFEECRRLHATHGKTYYLANAVPVLIAGGATALEAWLRPILPSQPRQFAVTIAVRSWWLSGLCKGRTH